MLIGLLITALLIYPLVPISNPKKGKQPFSLIYYTDFTNEEFDLAKHFEVTPENTSDIEVIINVKTLNTNENMPDVVFESTDWVLELHDIECSITTRRVDVTYYNDYDPPLPSMTRIESHVTSLFPKLFLRFTSKSTSVTDTATRVLLSETVSGEFDYGTYVANAKESEIPVSSKQSFDLVDIVNKETNASEIGFTYDTEEDSYVQGISVKVDYELDYWVTKVKYVSILISEITVIKGAFITAIVSAFVVAVISLINQQHRKLQESPPI